MTSPFEEATAIVAASRGRYRAVVPDGWQQGKGAFGGVVIGILTRAILAFEADPSRRLRSLTANLCAPALVGPADVSVVMLRRGASMSFVDARLTQNGEVVAHASAAVAGARPVTPPALRTPSPPRIPWNDVEPLPPRLPFVPVFTHHFEYRSTGPLPIGGATEAVTEGWIRAAHAPSIVDEAVIVGLLDAWWPTTRSVEEVQRPVATAGYTMQLLVDPRELSPEEPLFYRGRGVASADNYFVEMRELWSGDRVVAMNQQTFAVLG
jgi:hypothetical protein